jgi:hypothetical protein
VQIIAYWDKHVGYGTMQMIDEIQAQTKRIGMPSQNIYLARGSGCGCLYQL